jgi:hypothetical protein
MSLQVNTQATASEMIAFGRFPLLSPAAMNRKRSIMSDRGRQKCSRSPGSDRPERGTHQDDADDNDAGVTASA